MSYLETKDLKKGGVYHIKNNYARNLDEVWFNNSKLINIEEDWSEPIILTFMLENGKELVIDGDFVSKTSGEHKSQRKYQIIASKTLEY